MGEPFAYKRLPHILTVDFEPPAAATIIAEASALSSWGALDLSELNEIATYNLPQACCGAFT